MEKSNGSKFEMYLVGFFGFVVFVGLVGVLFLRNGVTTQEFEQKYGSYKLEASITTKSSGTETFLCQNAPQPNILVNCVNLSTMEFFNFITFNEGVTKLKIRE